MTTGLFFLAVMLLGVPIGVCLCLAGIVYIFATDATVLFQSFPSRGNLGFQAEPETSRKKLSDINHLARRRPLLGTLKSSRVRPRSSASFSHVGRRPRPAQVLPLPSW